MWKSLERDQSSVIGCVCVFGGGEDRGKWV